MSSHKVNQKKIALYIPNLAWQDADKPVIWHITPYNNCLIAAIIREFCDVQIIDANFHNYFHEQFQAKLLDYALTW